MKYFRGALAFAVGAAVIVALFLVSWNFGTIT